MFCDIYCVKLFFSNEFLRKLVSIIGVIESIIGYTEQCGIAIFKT